MGWLSLALQDGGVSLSNYTQFFTNPSYYRAMTNSLEVTALVTIISVALAYPFAWILAEQVPEKWQRLALLLAVLPFWTSYVVRSYSWLLVLAQKGVVNSVLLGSDQATALAEHKRVPIGMYPISVGFFTVYHVGAIVLISRSTGW